jgi:hypothetical protein
MVLRDHIAREGFAMLERIEVEEEAGGQSARTVLSGVSDADRLSYYDELSMVTVLPHTTAVKATVGS